jgi:LPXTG-motif cell wall-anchored protein
VLLGHSAQPLLLFIMVRFTHTGEKSMKRTFATLGVVGLGLLSLTAPALADSGSTSDDKIIICHAGSGSNSGHFTMNYVAVPSLNGHDRHAADIIPPNDGLKYGQNWDAVGKAVYANGCAALPPEEEVKPPVVVPPVEVPPVEVPPVVVPPVEVPPVEVPPAEVPPVEVPPVVVQPPVETPVVETPVTTPVVQTPSVERPAVAPPAATAAVVPEQPATAAAGVGTNQGYNAQTAVGGSDSPSWLAGAGALMAAGAAVAFRRSRRTLPMAD